ncbi:MAG: hypothetical protein WC705_02925 [Candidatus Paceibacterota bacterium]|jgi:hypothetical protein
MNNPKEIKRLKEILEKSKDINNGDVVNFLKQEEETELANFLEKIDYTGKKIEPERLLTIKILDNLKSQKMSPRGDLRASSFINKIRLQLHMPNILKAGIPLALAVLVGIVIFADPFTSENYQVEELKNLGKDETMIQDLSSDINKYFQEESKLLAVDEGLSAASSAGKLAAPEVLSMSFDVDSIDLEAAQVSIDSDLANFFEQESEFYQMDSTLANF